MLIDHSWARTRLGVCSMALILVAAGWDDPPGVDKPTEDVTKPASKPDASFDPTAEGGLNAAVGARLPKIDSIKPLPLVPIPDDPPPHEGAMIDLPYIVEPPDLIRVEVLEALPGRPIEGERLVRPDGTITLGFYGDIHVRGLTIPQVKEKVILHLRKYIKDETLGILVPDPQFDFGPQLLPPPPPGFDPKDAFPPDVVPPVDPEKSSPQPSGATTKTTSTSRRITPRTDPRTRPRRESSAQPQRIRRISDEGISIPPQPSTAVVSNQRGVKVTIEVEGAGQDAEPSVPSVPSGFTYPGERHVLVDPAENNRVYIDVAAYNSKVFFVVGDVGAPGRLPCTGHDTVLDALNYAGGFSPTADVTNVRLVRPARAGNPAKIYPIDYMAIVKNGDARANLQVLPGDRLVVGRHPTVQTSIELDRLVEPKNRALSYMSTYASVMRALANIYQPYASDSDSLRFKFGGYTVRIDPDRPKFDDAQRAAIMKEWAEFWSRSLRSSLPRYDDHAVTDQILRQLAPEHPLGPEPAKPTTVEPRK